MFAAFPLSSLMSLGIMANHFKTKKRGYLKAGHLGLKKKIKKMSTTDISSFILLNINQSINQSSLFGTLQQSN